MKDPISGKGRFASNFLYIPSLQEVKDLSRRMTLAIIRLGFQLFQATKGCRIHHDLCRCFGLFEVPVLARFQWIPMNSPMAN
jgi:hypothetical protein